MSVLKSVISGARIASGEEFISLVKRAGKILMDAKPHELVIGNIVRRVCYMVREEYIKKEAERSGRPPVSFSPFAPPPLPPSSAPSTPAAPAPHAWEASPSSAGSSEQIFELMRPSLFTVLSSGHNVARMERTMDLKNDVVADMEELLTEVEDTSHNIAREAVNFVHASEVVLTYGGSRTVVEFLKSAGRKRKFQVFVVEGASPADAHDLALELTDHSHPRNAESRTFSPTPTTVITTSQVFAIMAKVNKVIIGTHAILANGGLIADVGVHQVCLAAKAHSVPVMVCAGMFKLSPLFATDQEQFIERLAPSGIIPFDSEANVENATIYRHEYEFVPPELISLFVTNTGPQDSAYFYRMVMEVFSIEDYSL